VNPLQHHQDMLDLDMACEAALRLLQSRGADELAKKLLDDEWMFKFPTPVRATG
jgi:hypothetical protein